MRTAPSVARCGSAARDALSRDATPSRSARVTMPPGPLPATVLRSMLKSAASRRTNGDAGGDAAGLAAPAVEDAGVRLRRARGADSLVPYPTSTFPDAPSAGAAATSMLID